MAQDAPISNPRKARMSSIEQAPPQATGVEARVCELIASRQQLGIKKYRTTVEGAGLGAGQWLQHLIEELADALIYAKALQEEVGRLLKDGK